MVLAMDRLLAAVAGLAALAAAAPAGAVDRRLPVTDFDRIVVEGPYIVRLRVGGPTTATVSGSQAALDRVSLDVSGNMLRIRRNRNYWGGNPGAQESPVTIELGTRTLRSARLLGPARLEIDRIEGLRIDLAVQGSGRLVVGSVAADNLSVGMAGSGQIELAGRAESLTADIQGSGDLDAAGLSVENATVQAATSGTIALEATETATVTALGLGTIEITGQPACTLRGPSADLVRCGRPR
jgi:hypothetical protein